MRRPRLWMVPAAQSHEATSLSNFGPPAGRSAQPSVSGASWAPAPLPAAPGVQPPQPARSARRPPPSPAPASRHAKGAFECAIQLCFTRSALLIKDPHKVMQCCGHPNGCHHVLFAARTGPPPKCNSGSIALHSLPTHHALCVQRQQLQLLHALRQLQQDGRVLVVVAAEA